MTLSCPIYIRKLSWRLPVHFKARLFSCRRAERFSRPTVNEGHFLGDSALILGSAWGWAEGLRKKPSCWGFHQHFPCALCSSPSRSFTFNFVFSLKAAWCNKEPSGARCEILITSNWADQTPPDSFGGELVFLSDLGAFSGSGLVLFCCFYLWEAIPQHPQLQVHGKLTFSAGEWTCAVLCPSKLWMVDFGFDDEPWTATENEMKLPKTLFAPSSQVSMFVVAVSIKLISCNKKKKTKEKK